MDHNMSISNPCISTTDLLKRAYLQPPLRPFGVRAAPLPHALGVPHSPRDLRPSGCSCLTARAPPATSKCGENRRGT